MKFVGAVFVIAALFASTNAVPLALNNAAKVKVNFYLESLCPGCREFSTTTLSDVVKSLGDIIELKIFPYGNARNDSGTLECQHGESECQGNLVETCLVSLYPDRDDFFPVFECLEKSGDPVGNLEECSKKSANVDASKISACSTSDAGKSFEWQMEQATESLQPAHEFVPWVTVNDSPLGQDMDSLKQYVCQAYQGKLPSACNDAHTSNKLGHTPVCKRP